MRRNVFPCTQISLVHRRDLASVHKKIFVLHERNLFIYTFSLSGKTVSYEIYLLSRNVFSLTGITFLHWYEQILTPYSSILPKLFFSQEASVMASFKVCAPIYLWNQRFHSFAAMQWYSRETPVVILLDSQTKVTSITLGMCLTLSQGWLGYKHS